MLAGSFSWSVTTTGMAEPAQPRRVVYGKRNKRQRSVPGSLFQAVEQHQPEPREPATCVGRNAFSLLMSGRGKEETKKRPKTSHPKAHPTKSSRSVSAGPHSSSSSSNWDYLEEIPAGQSGVPVDVSKLEQVYLDAGQRILGSVNCPLCHLVYTPGKAEDEKLHYARHDQFLYGVALKAWKNQTKQVVASYASEDALRTDVVLELSCDDAPPERVFDTLAMMNTDLGDDTHTQAQAQAQAQTLVLSPAHWDPACDSGGGRVGGQARRTLLSLCPPRSKLYIYAQHTQKRGKRLVGCCVAVPLTPQQLVRQVLVPAPVRTPVSSGPTTVADEERDAGLLCTPARPACSSVRQTEYTTPGAAVPSQPHATPSAPEPLPTAAGPVTVAGMETALESKQPPHEDHGVPAWLGIDKIWVHSSARRCGIATRLLDAALRNFRYGQSADRSECAFSSPTEWGAKLAARYIGRSVSAAAAKKWLQEQDQPVKVQEQAGTQPYVSIKVYL